MRRRRARTGRRCSRAGPGPPPDRSRRIVRRPRARLASRDASNRPLVRMPPAQPAVRQIVGPAQVAQHLGGWRGFLAGLPRRPVERAEPSFRLDDGEAELVALPFLREAVGPRLAVRIGKQQAVRHVLSRPLAERFCWGSHSAQPSSPRTGQIRSSSVWLSLGDPPVGKRGEDVIQPGFERVERSLVERLPVVRLRNRHAKKIAREKAALKRPVDAHAAAPARRIAGRPTPSSARTAAFPRPGRRPSSSP